MRESKAASINMTKERVVVLVKMRVALCSHTRVSHNHVYAVRNVDFHLPSGNWALVNSQAVIEIVGDAGCVRAAHLTFARQRVQDFVLGVGAQALFKVD